MQKNTDQESGDLRASSGEVVRRYDLDRAAGTPGKFARADPAVAGYDGVRLARAALRGDQAALDEFHERAGLVVTDVTDEYGKARASRLVMVERPKVGGLEFHGVCQGREVQAMFGATGADGIVCAYIDATELVAWIHSPEGRAALARRGIPIPDGPELQGHREPELEVQTADLSDRGSPPECFVLLSGDPSNTQDRLVTAQAGDSGVRIESWHFLAADGGWTSDEDGGIVLDRDEADRLRAALPGLLEEHRSRSAVRGERE